MFYNLGASPFPVDGRQMTDKPTNNDSENKPLQKTSKALTCKMTVMKSLRTEIGSLRASNECSLRRDI